jgi:hypothetical protein
MPTTHPGALPTAGRKSRDRLWEERHDALVLKPKAPCLGLPAQIGYRLQENVFDKDRGRKRYGNTATTDNAGKNYFPKVYWTVDMAQGPAQEM